MSMAGTGVVSRLTGETFGSALTFGAATKASAPGQINVNELEQVLDIIHKSLWSCNLPLKGSTASIKKEREL